VTVTYDREFLHAAGIEPYEPEEFLCERGEDFRDNLIKAIAILQFVAIVASLVWMSV
jgi:hypothetical protein